MIPTAPTGIYTIAYSNKIEIHWVKNPETIKGYNIYNSTTSGGGISGYVKLNTTLIEQYSTVQKNVISTNTQVTENGGQKTTTVTETYQDVYIFLYSHENLTSEQKQYYVVTAVNELGEESPYSIEVEDVPLIITTEILLEPLRTQNDIALDYIATLLEREPKLDVKPGSVTRQLHIDPNSREISFVYVRRDFVSRSQSFLTLNNLDDSNGDRISDEVSSSSYKQLLKQAYFFTNDVDVQNMIDFAFDKLAADGGTYRKGATASEGVVVFYTTITPTVDITVSANEIVSTVPTETQAAIQFKTMSTQTMKVSTIQNYFNASTQRYELNIYVQAVNTGSIGDVKANTIVNTNITGLQVTNPTTTFGGTDRESNANLSDHAQLAFRGLDVGTSAGYKKSITKMSGINDVEIVSAGDPLMQRDYDEVRKKHVYGKVDIYIKGGEPIPYQDTIGFLFKQSKDETFEIIDPVQMIIRSNNTNVSSTKPIFNVREIKNVFIPALYDLTGNWTVYKNAIEMEKITDVTVDLITGTIFFTQPLLYGDVITSTYDYKTSIVGEVLIDPASGGEVSFSLAHQKIVKRSYTVYKNSIVLQENIDYVLTLLNGFLQLTSGLNPGDSLVIDYKYITSVTNEIVQLLPNYVQTASGGETQGIVINTNILESLLINPDGITLEIESTNAINSSVGMEIGQRITCIYRYRDSDPILLLNQPVDSISSVVSSSSGSLVENVNYFFNKIDDILLEGNSIKAARTVQLEYANGIPIGDLVTGEEDIVLVNNNYRELSKKGIDPESISVKDQTKTYQLTNDYLIKFESSGYNVQIVRSTTSTIPNGGTVTVTYEYGELITITYNTNPLVAQAQQYIEPVRHVTADVLVKEVLETKIDFAISVVIKTGTNEIQVSSDIQTAISDEIYKKRLGEGVAQSDIIRVIEEVVNVNSVLVPLTKMVKANGTQINREYIGVPFESYQTSIVDSYSTGINALLQKTLGSNSGDGFYAVFEDDRPLVLVTSSVDVDLAAGQAFISLDGEVIVSTISSDQPSAHTYTVSYVVNGESGAKDINVTSLEFLSIGEIIITTSFPS